MAWTSRSSGATATGIRTSPTPSERCGTPASGGALCLLTSAYASYPGCRQYREDLAAASAAVGAGCARCCRGCRTTSTVRASSTPFVDGTQAALDRMPAGARVVFVTHSIPDGDERRAAARPAAATSPSTATSRPSSREEVARRRGTPVDWDLVFCSRSGPPRQPWLEPDVNDHLTALAAKDVPGVVVVPIGFVSDHMEVLYDLDTEARSTADRLGLAFARVPTPGVDPRFVGLVRELLTEHAGDVSIPPVLGALGPTWGNCPAGCCPNPRGARPALCGED